MEQEDHQMDEDGHTRSPHQAAPLARILDDETIQNPGDRP
jgi:hypothetical protein